MGRYNPEDPSMNFCYEIGSKEIFKKIVETAFEWYKVSDKLSKYSNEYPEYYSECEECYNKLIDEINHSDDDERFGYYLDESNELFSEYLYNVVPFTINHIEGQGIYLTPCYDKKDLEYSSYEEIRQTLYYGDDIEEEISLHSIDFDKRNTLMFIKHFLKFLNDADLNYIKYKISWKFLHSSWN